MSPDLALETERDDALATIERLLARAVATKASDLHLMAGERPRLRVAGELAPLVAEPVFSRADVEAVLSATCPPARRASAADEREVDYSYTDGVGRRYRVASFLERRGPALAFRVLGGRPPTVEELALPSHILRAVYAPGGLVLFAGHAGAGKTTTLASVLQELCVRRVARLITVEDPIEFRLDPEQAYVEQREVGIHCPTFAAGVADAIEAAPDAIAIGELRDLETIRLGLRAAETGILVLATVHAHDTTRAIGRIVDAFEIDDRAGARLALSATVRMIVAQTLVRRSDKSGRVAACEIVHGSTSLATLIREGKEHELTTLIEGNRGRGMGTLDDSLLELAASGTIADEDALFHSVHRDQVTRRLGEAARVARSANGGEKPGRAAR